MVLDIRAEVICNLGPVISGSVKDDHVQGQGLVMSTGDLVIAGLITPAHGDLVELSYVTPDGVAARFPRGPFYVTQAFANPLSNQTELQIADKLAYEKGKGGGVVNASLVDGLNGRLPKVAKAMDLREALDVIASRVGIEIEDAGDWELTKQISELSCDDYVETISDILASVNYFGHLNDDSKLITYSYKDLSDNGPVLDFDKVIDLGGNQGGLDFTENPTGTGTAQTVNGTEDEPTTEWLAGSLIVEGDYGNFVATWDSSTTTTETSIKVTLKNGLTSTYSITETVETYEEKAEPDNRVLERTTVTTTSLVKVNSQVVQDYLNAGIPGPSANTPVTSRKTETYTYEEIPPPPLSEQEEEQVKQEIEAAQQAIAESQPGTDHPVLTPAGTIVLLPELPTFREIRNENSETMSYVEALGRIGVKDYTKMGAIPEGEGIKQSIITDTLYTGNKQKKIERTYVAYGLTQMGQQAISAAAIKATTGADFQPFLDQFFRLVIEDVKVVTSDLNTSTEGEPVPSYLAPYQTATAVIQGGSRIEVGADPESRSNNTLNFSVPFLPDDVVNDDGSITTGESTTAAADYAEEQNRLLLGHRLGLQLTTALGLLPTSPLSAFHLTSNGITATYRTNGTAWSFDSNSCIVSTDALYWGVEGDDINGPLWTPVAPGTTALPVPPPVIDNGPQPPVNSTTTVSTAAGNVSVSSIVASLATADLSSYQSIVADLFTSLPTGEPEVFEKELQPTALALPFKKISNAALEVRLQLETLLVPNGINRSMGDLDLEWQLQLEAVQQLSGQVRLQFDSAERQLLEESLSGGYGMGGNLS